MTTNLETLHARSGLLSDDDLGAIARIDPGRSGRHTVTPVDYKRGTVPNIPGNVYEPERVQLCLQGLLLRAHGYRCDEGVIYFVGSKRRVTVAFDDELVTRTRSLLHETRVMADRGEIPAPLEDSPKCPRCSLVGICLPDEVTFLRGGRHIVKPDDVRRMVTVRDDALPMYVITQGAVVGKSGDTLTVRQKGETIATARLLDVSSLSIFGNAQVTAQATRELLDRGIPICHFTYGGWLKGVTSGMTHKNVELRMAQFRSAADRASSLAHCQEMVTAQNPHCASVRRISRRTCAVLNETRTGWSQSVEAADSLQTLLASKGRRPGSTSPTLAIC